MSLKFKLMIVLAFVGATCSIAHAQKIPSKLRYVVLGQDTILCKTITFSYSRRGVLKYARYVDLNGNAVYSNTEQGLPNVTTIFMRDTTYDRVPIQPKKPDSPIWYAPRMAGGKINLYLTDKTYYYGNNHVGGYYRFTFQMPDGKFYKVTYANVNKIVKPYVLQCPNFVERYKGLYNSDSNDFYQLVTIYNYQCK